MSCVNHHWKELLAFVEVTLRHNQAIKFAIRCLSKLIVAHGIV